MRGALVILGLALGLLLVELILRLLPGLLPPPVMAQAWDKPGIVRWHGLPRFMAEYRRLWRDDPLLRERLIAGLDTVLHGHPEYPRWPIRSSGLGLGGAGFRDQRPLGTPFAVVLGDSFAFAVGVERREGWVEVMEQSSGRSFVNLSQVGASSLQEALIYQHYGRPLAAPLVLWTFFQNDLKENLRFAAWADPAAAVPQAARPPRCTSGPHRLLRRLSLSYELWLASRGACAYTEELVRSAAQPHGQVFCRDHDICDPQVQDRMLQFGWPLARQAILQTRARVEAAGGRFAVVIVPAKEQVYGELYRVAADLPPEHDLDRLVRPLRELCAVADLDCLDLSPIFRAAIDSPSGPERPLYFSVDIHWTAAGHSLASAAVLNFLEQRALLNLPNSP